MQCLKVWVEEHNLNWLIELLLASHPLNKPDQLLPNHQNICDITM